MGYNKPITLLDIAISFVLIGIILVLSLWLTDGSFSIGIACLGVLSYAMLVGLVYGYGRFVVRLRVDRLIHYGKIASATILDLWNTDEVYEFGTTYRHFIAYRFTAHTPNGEREIVRSEQVPNISTDIRPPIGEVVPVYYLPNKPQHCLLERYVKLVL
jgi:hypothetical protein